MFSVLLFLFLIWPINLDKIKQNYWNSSHSLLGTTELLKQQVLPSICAYINVLPLSTIHTSLWFNDITPELFFFNNFPTKKGTTPWPISINLCCSLFPKDIIVYKITIYSCMYTCVSVCLCIHISEFTSRFRRNLQQKQVA